MSPPWILAIDGGARGNPGPAGAGAVLSDATGRRLAAHHFPLGSMTNNAAEYLGLIRGLELAQVLGARRLDVRSDSELLVRQLSGEYRTRAEHLRDLAIRVRELAAGFASVSFAAVPREHNTESDRLANLAMDEVERALAASKGQTTTGIRKEDA